MDIVDAIRVNDLEDLNDLRELHEMLIRYEDVLDVQRRAPVW